MSDVTLYSIPYQRQVLQLLCTNTRFALDFGSILRQEYFETPAARMIFDVINKYILAYEKELDQNDLLVKIDEYIVSRGLSNEIFSMLKDEVKEIFREYIKSEQALIDTLVKFCRRMEMKNALIHGADMLGKDPDSYESVLKKIDSAVSIGAGYNEGLSFKSLFELPTLIRSRYNPENLYQTGIYGYDQALMGGLAPGELHVIQSPPKCGKSTLAANIGAHGLRMEKNVFHVSLEINEIDVATKYAARLTGMSYQELNNIGSEEYRKKIAPWEKTKGNLFINFWPEGTTNALAVRSWISRIRAKYGKSPDIIIIDYDDCLNTVSGSYDSDDLYGRSGEIYKDLIGLANYFSVPVLTFAQPQREAWDLPNKFEVIKAHNLAHSARKAHRCSSISSLNFAEGKEDGILYLDLARRGESNVKLRMKRDLKKAYIGFDFG